MNARILSIATLAALLWGLSTDSLYAARWLFRDMGTLGNDTHVSRSLGVNDVAGMTVGESEWSGGTNTHAWCFWNDPRYPMSDITESIVRFYQSGVSEHASVEHDNVVARYVGNLDWITGTIEVSLNATHTEKQVRSWMCKWPPAAPHVVGFTCDLGDLAPGADIEMHGINVGRRAAGTAFDAAGVERAVVGSTTIRTTTLATALSPTGPATRAWGISDRNWVVGSIDNSSGTQACYWTLSDGTWRRRDIPFGTELGAAELIETYLRPDEVAEARGVAVAEIAGDRRHAITGFSGEPMRPVVWVEESGGAGDFRIIDPVASMLTQVPVPADAYASLPQSGHGMFVDTNENVEAVGWVRTGTYEAPDDGETATRAIRSTYVCDCDGPSYGVIQEVDEVVWHDRPDREIAEDGWTLLTAVGISNGRRVVGTAWDGSRIHAYVMNLEGDVLDPDCKVFLQPFDPPPRREPSLERPSAKSLISGPTFDIAMRDRGMADLDVLDASGRFRTSNLWVVGGGGAVIEEVRNPNFRHNVSLMVAGKQGDWAVAYWGGTLRLLGDYQSIGASQGFNAMRRVFPQMRRDMKSGEVQPVREQQLRRMGSYVYGDTRADGGLFVDWDDFPFVFGAKSESGAHRLPKALVGERVAGVACGEQFNCVIRRRNGELVAWGGESGGAIRDLRKTGLAANGQYGVAVVDVAGTRRGIVALAKDGHVHLFGRAHGAAPGKPCVLSPANLGLKADTRIVEVKGIPGTDAWALRDSAGFVHLQGAVIHGQREFYSPAGFFVGHGARRILLAARL